MMRGLISKLPAALCLGLAAAVGFGSLLATSDPLLAKNNNNSNTEPSGYHVQAKLWVGPWELRSTGIEEDTVYYLVNGDYIEKSKADVGVDAIVFVFDPAGAPLGCQLSHLTHMDVAAVNISTIPALSSNLLTVADLITDLTPFGTVKILTYQGGQGFQGDSSKNSANPIDAKLGVWAEQQDTGTGASVGITNVYPVPLTDKEQTYIESAFSFASKCAVQSNESPKSKSSKKH
ncbi:MAG: hypothetical protein IT307_00235 [Chloroflexi bacterium]|nr:hypothetical protein [Chloroflexota bacterium]